MSDAVNADTGGESPGQRTRRYDSTRRRAAAAETRGRILDAARARFLANGYTATTVAEIARDADVVADTIYATVGRKPALFRELIELSLSGTGRPVPGAQRDYAVRMRDEPDARDRLRIYAEAVTAIQTRLGPLFLVLREAATADADLKDLWSEITDRRAENMRGLASDLASTGQLRGDLTIDEVADVVWTMNSAEYYAMLVADRGWSSARFTDWLFDAWCRLLLDETG
ncbi:TetR/AcrR family transcriptional regulator [Gordonia insulae]|uniref:HTH-type transcriptional regulator AcrR n=1 Tax=Gordonia insulae TaxID=2420509 RepID=A0A3G8JGC0_9ACTN|nr:TetR/AcrR family transcriptional regulator [Gordonia insulae]AZG44116.1 HTH-type transcriptional regulator AcrR [Gordonia insulae]